MRRTFLSAICSTRRLQQDFRIKLLRPARNGIHSLSPPTAPAPCLPVATPNEQFPLKGHYHFWEPTLAAVFGLVFGEQEERVVGEGKAGGGSVYSLQLPPSFLLFATWQFCMHF